MEISSKTAVQLGLTEEEFDRIKKILGRTPNFNELSAYSVMWSEHCSYKNSIRWLKTLPQEGGRMLVGAGEENAGLLDIGDGLGLVFKIESHNHPSAVEPFQGAATGVGGIHRDIFTMGARPIAAMNSLRFGDPHLPRTKHLINGIVKGIGHYGNCFGVPTVGGEAYFEKIYHVNPLVNAFSAGIVEVGKTVSATAYGEGNTVFIAGSATGKDGMGGAAFASADLHEDSAEDLPAVQVGDPFQEKKLLEACMEVIPTGALIGMQDMGAAGIICSTAETSAKGESGMDINLDKVPVRQEGMKAWELLLSESQERMLLIVKKGREKEVLDIFEKWDLPCSEIGTVNNSGTLRFYMHGELEAEMPAESLVLGGGAPVYEREYRAPEYLKKIEHFSADEVPVSNDLKSVAGRLLSNPNISSKKWIYRQYDSTVGAANMNTNDPSDASVVSILGTKKALAMSTDCNSRYVFADPHVGCMIAVAESARNIVCSGGEPLGVTNCLNFGNPYNPEVYYQFVKSIQGMSEACLKFGTPVTGGNVSFYNQSEEGPIYPTPVIGMVGLIEDAANKMSLSFKNEGDLIYLLGVNKEDFGSSEYLHKIKEIEYSSVPYFDLEEEFALHQTIKLLIGARLVNSVHDISEGGLFTCLAESSFQNELGFSVKAQQNYRADAYWFGEAQGRAVVSVSPDRKEAFEQAVSIPFELLGKAEGRKILVEDEDWGNVSEWKEMYMNTLTDIMEGEA